MKCKRCSGTKTIWIIPVDKNNPFYTVDCPECKGTGIHTPNPTKEN